MAPTDPTTWDIWTWWLWAMGLYYLVGFFVHWVRFRRLERDVEARRKGSVKAWNKGISGFPAAGYAKMMGKRKLEPDWRGRPKRKDLRK